MRSVPAITATSEGIPDTCLIMSTKLENPLNKSRDTSSLSSDKSTAGTVSAMMLAARLAKNAKHKRNKTTTGKLNRKMMKTRKSSTDVLMSQPSRSGGSEQPESAKDIELVEVRVVQHQNVVRKSLDLISIPANKQNLKKKLKSLTRTSSSHSAFSRSNAAQAAAACRIELETVSQEMRQGHSMPLKDALKGLYRVNRYKTFYGLMTWATFVFVTFQVLRSVRDTAIVYEQESALEDLFIDEEFKSANFKKNFADVMALDELWDWLEGPLLSGAYPDDYYNGERKTINDRGYILDVMKLVGGIRIRQHRVTGNSCNSRRFVSKQDISMFGDTGAIRCQRAELNETCEKDKNDCGLNICSCTNLEEKQNDGTNTKYPICPFDRLDQSCYSEYNTDTSGEITADTISILLYRWFKVGKKRTHSDDLGSTFIPKFSTIKDAKKYPARYSLSKLNSTAYSAIPAVGKESGDFGTWGYYQDLPLTNHTRAAEILAEMKNELWVDARTRLVTVTFQVYNTMSRYVTVARFAFEVENTGRIFSRGEFFTFPLITYSSTVQDRVRTVMEIIMCLLAFFFVQREFKKSNRIGVTNYCCRRKSTWLEIISIGFVSIFIFYFYWFQLQLGSVANDYHVMKNEYTDLYSLALKFQTVVDIGAFWFLMASIKFLKYLSISKEAMMLFRTVVAAKSLLFSFLISMGMLLLLFSFTAHFLYGSRLEEFHSLERSLIQMFRWMVGDVDYEELYHLRPKWTPLVYLLFQIIFFYLALNMLIAIVINQFDKVQTKAQTESKWKREVSPLYEDLYIRCDINTLRCRTQCCPWICCCCFRRTHAEKVLKLLNMSKLEASLHVKRKRRTMEQIVAWEKAHNQVMEHWKCSAMLTFQKQIRRLQRFGKSKKTGSGVNLYEFLEELYNSWEVRALEGMEGGFEINDSRLPIAVISANRLAFFVCKTESFDAVNESSQMFSTNKITTKIEVDSINNNRSIIVSAKEQQKRLNRGSSYQQIKQMCCGCSCPGCCPSNSFEEKSRRQINSELIQKGVQLSEATIAAFYKVSRSIVVGPLNSDVIEWSNSTAIKGEKLRLSMTKSEIRGCLYECQVSTVMVGSKSKQRHIFVDETSAQLYILEKCNIHTRQEHFKATGPIRIIVDLFYLQQIHVDVIDERVLCLRLDDNVGRSFRLVFASKRRRDTCIDLLIHSCQMFTGDTLSNDDERFVVFSSDDESETEEDNNDIEVGDDASIWQHSRPHGNALSPSLPTHTKGLSTFKNAGISTMKRKKKKKNQEEKKDEEFVLPYAPDDDTRPSELTAEHARELSRGLSFKAAGIAALATIKSKPPKKNKHTKKKRTARGSTVFMPGDERPKFVRPRFSREAPESGTNQRTRRQTQHPTNNGHSVDDAILKRGQRKGRERRTSIVRPGADLRSFNY